MITTPNVLRKNLAENFKTKLGRDLILKKKKECK